MRRFVAAVIAGFAGCGSGEDGSSPEANVCEQSVHYTQSCFGDPPSGTVSDDQCTAELACSQACVLDASCDVLLVGQAADPVGWQVLYDCQVACLGQTTGGSGSSTHPTGTGGTDPYGDTGTGPYTEPETSTGTDDAPRPECAAYADVYCGCLGDIAAPTCVEVQAEQCDWIYDLAPEFYDCVTAANCSGDWIGDCTGR